MNLFGLTISRNRSGGEQKSVSRSETLRELFGGGSHSKSGAAVNWKTALEVTTVLACVRVIAEGIAQVPFKLFLSQGGQRNPANDHPLYALLATKPNAWQTSFEFREQIALHLVLCGNAYVWINRLRGRVLELLPYAPGNVTVKRDRDGWIVGYSVSMYDGRLVEIPADDMWHLRGPSWDGVVGLESVRLAREAIGLALATEEHGARMFSNGARVGGVLSTDGGKPSDDQLKLMREGWQRTQGGNANAYKTAVLWGGMKWTPVGMPNDQAQLLEQRRFQVEEACRALRVMPIMVGHADKTATYASAEQMFLAHVVHTLGPWYARIEQSADANLLTDAERAQGYYSKFMAQGLMRGSTQARADFYTRLYGIGALNPNEIRELEERRTYLRGRMYEANVAY